MALTPDAAMPSDGGRKPAPYAGRERKRAALLAIFVLSWVGTALAWAVMESRGVSSPTLRAVFAANIVFHPLLFATVYWRLLPNGWST